SLLHRTATATYLCCVPTLEDSAGAGRAGLAFCKGTIIFYLCKHSTKTIYLAYIMKNRNLFILFALRALFFSCKDETPSFKFNTAHLKQHHKSVETISLEVLNEKNTTIDSVIYYINNQRIASVKGNSKLEYKLENERFGKKSLKGLVY